MKTNHIDSRGIVGGDYFRIYYTRGSDINLDFYINKFNINEYYIYKMTANFREVTKEQFFEFGYGGYMFFKKDIYSNRDIDEWIEYLRDKKIIVLYLCRPFPPKKIMNKIKIIK